MKNVTFKKNRVVKKFERQHLNREIKRALKQFFIYIRKEDSVKDSFSKVYSSYGNLVGSCVEYYIIKHFKKI